MGRKPILIQPIQLKRKREDTFRKRFPGLVKKGHELGVLCNQDIFMFVRDRSTGRVRSYRSTNERFVPDYSRMNPGDAQGPVDVGKYYKPRSVDPYPAVVSQPVTKPPQSIISQLASALRVAGPTLLSDSRRCAEIVSQFAQTPSVG
jgi:hypothetical protein